MFDGVTSVIYVRSSILFSLFLVSFLLLLSPKLSILFR